MSDAPVDRGMRGRLIGMMLGSLLVVYVGTSVPVIVYCDRHGHPGSRQFYRPLGFLAQHWPLFEEQSNRYFQWCEAHLFLEE